jgi:hypothetical protein
MPKQARQRYLANHDCADSDDAHSGKPLCPSKIRRPSCLQECNDQATCGACAAYSGNDAPACNRNALDPGAVVQSHAAKHRKANGRAAVLKHFEEGNCPPVGFKDGSAERWDSVDHPPVLMRE